MRSIWIFLTLLFASVSGTALAEKRVALVIGNSAYLHVPQLANPKNDAGSMSAKLNGLGFEVVTGQDLDLNGMRKSIRDFVGKLDGADIALFFYAGHGLQVNGSNYMAPVDAQLGSYDDLDFEALPIELVLSAMERNAKVNLVFLDACRDNPLAETLARSMGTRSTAVGRGLAKLETGIGSLIAFATQPGNVALDGAAGNSPFTTALLKYVGTPGRSLTDELTDVRRAVLAATSGKQVPWESSSLTGPVFLNPSQAPNLAAMPPAATADSDKSVELAYWDTIKDSTEKSFFEAYLRQYPTGAFGALATLKIAAIERQANQSPAAPPEQQRVSTAGGADAPEIASLEQPTSQVQPSGLPAMTSGELTRSIQGELARVGCLAGGVDGKWGDGSQSALKAYAERKGLKLTSLAPTEGVLDGLKATGDRVCPLVCGDGMEARGDRCVSPGLSALNGTWKLTRRATTDCGAWRELTGTVYISSDGKISSGSGFIGKITSGGAFNIAQHFVHKGKKGSNVATGTIKGNKGTGRFKGTGAGLGCSGNVIMSKM